VSERVAPSSRSFGRLVAASAITTMLAVAAVSCGGDADDAAPAGGGAVVTDATIGTTTDASSNGSVSAGDPAIGEQLMRSQGCAGCHGQNFGGGAGPPLVGLAGSEVSLADGTTVVADTDYLVRSIADPAAQLVAGYNLRMPANSLSDGEIADIVAFIETLG